MITQRRLKVQSMVPPDILDYINRLWDVRVLVRNPKYSRDTLEGIQLVVDSLNQINTDSTDEED